MNDLMQYLPLLNLLVIPLFMAYTRNEVRMSRLEDHKSRVEHHLGWRNHRLGDDGKDS
jgi:hypothetical protein